MWFVVIRPPEGLSTAAVYGACRPSELPKPIELLVAETKRRNWPAIGPIAHNGLLPAARELSPQVGRVIERLKKVGSPLVGMSGSGTSCFAVARNGAEARQLARRLQSEGFGRAWAVRSA
jgi:4-diphosphocytidyl-2-C-methyl-D-erythritol kinase